MADAVYWLSWWAFTCVGVGVVASVTGCGESLKQKDVEISKYKELYEHNLNAAMILDQQNIDLRKKLATLAFSVKQDLSDEDLKRLTMLCHPDKHGGKRIAVEMTQKLLSMRQPYFNR